VNRGFDVYTYGINFPVAIKTLNQFLFSVIQCKNDQTKEEWKSGLCGTQKERDEKAVNEIVARKAVVKIPFNV